MRSYANSFAVLCSPALRAAEDSRVPMKFRVAVHFLLQPAAHWAVHALSSWTVRDFAALCRLHRAV
jgi:hypothetical protein